ILLEYLTSKINPKNISVLLFFSDMQNLLSESEKKQASEVSRILQEHARAGHFREIILVHTDLLEDISSNLQIDRYHEILNENLAHLIWAKEKIERSKPMLGNLTERAD